tara:strand:- start:1486 stop:1908 length:423 start_codon:yes stop_codon:yes gene_type:complete
MRLYFDSLPKLINKDNLEQYKRNSFTEEFILSTEGLFKITDNNILSKKISDSTFREYNINDHKFILDNSTYSFDKCNKIPFNHSYIKKHIDIFSLNPKSKNKLVIESLKKDVVDVYFDLNEYPDSPLVISDITTLVSLLN